MTKKHLLARIAKKLAPIVIAMLLQLAHPEHGDGFVVAGLVVMHAEAQQSGTHSGERPFVAVKMQVCPGDLQVFAVAKLLECILSVFKAAHFIEKQSFTHGGPSLCRSEGND